jgi:hypothetical protein
MPGTLAGGGVVDDLGVPLERFIRLPWFGTYLFENLAGIEELPGGVEPVGPQVVKLSAPYSCSAVPDQSSFGSCPSVLPTIRTTTFVAVPLGTCQDAHVTLARRP